MWVSHLELIILVFKHSCNSHTNRRVKVFPLDQYKLPHTVQIVLAKKIYMEQIEVLAVVYGYLQAVPEIEYSVQFNVHLLYTYWNWGEKSQIKLLAGLRRFPFWTFKYYWLFLHMFIHSLRPWQNKRELMTILGKISQSDLSISL